MKLAIILWFMLGVISVFSFENHNKNKVPSNVKDFESIAKVEDFDKEFESEGNLRSNGNNIKIKLFESIAKDDWNIDEETESLNVQDEKYKSSVVKLFPSIGNIKTDNENSLTFEDNSLDGLKSEAQDKNSSEKTGIISKIQATVEKVKNKISDKISDKTDRVVEKWNEFVENAENTLRQEGISSNGEVHKFTQTVHISQLSNSDTNINVTTVSTNSLTNDKNKAKNHTKSGGHRFFQKFINFFDKIKESTTTTTQFPEPEFISKEQHPICPLRVEPIYEEAVIEHAVHNVVTVKEPFESTIFQYFTETITHPVTVYQTSTITVEASPLQIVQTQIIDEDVYVTAAVVTTLDETLTETILKIDTHTVTNTETSTVVRPQVITLTAQKSRWITSTKTITSRITDWVSQLVEVTQPVYITTSLWVEAPQLNLITSTKVVPHYMTTTQRRTKTTYKTICKDD